MSEQHQPTTIGSGFIRCSCGWESRHHAHDKDMWNAFDDHIIAMTRAEK